MRYSTRKILALAAVVSMSAAACASDEPDAVTPDAPTETPVETNAPAGATEGDAAAFAVDDGASTLRAGLTSLLQEHVYLTGIVVETAVDAGGDLTGDEVVAAIAALDENTVALADAVGSAAGDENGEAFLGLWREHIGFFVNYTLGEATGDADMKAQALTDLEGYEQAAGAFFEEITGGEIVAADLIAGLEMHVSTLTLAIDGMVASDPAAFSDLRKAGQHMPNAALLLSTGIVAATS